MSNQLVITSGAKVRSLNGVITGTTGVLDSLPINAANGIPQLDVNGKILVSQLPNSVMEYQGTWNANTNTPTLTNGGAFNQGDVYLCNVAGTTNFGAGPIAFVVGDQVIYSGSIWQRASGSTGTVTSVAVTESGDALTITGSPIVNSGTINIGFAGTSAQYVAGNGSLITFPTLISSIGLTMPSAFTVSNSPLTANGTISVTGAGVASQYIRGDGTLADFPSSGGGGSSVSYYLNGGTSQGVIGGVTYYEMSKTADTGTGVDFPKTGDGLIVSFLTDANDPAQLNIPSGNWNYEIYVSMSSNGGTPQLYAELYKYDGTTFTLISTSSNEIIYDGVNLNLYTFAMAVPTTTLTVTERLAVKLYATNSGGKTTTVHTQNGHLCQVITTFSTGITALNGLTAQVQYLQVGTSGTDFNISSATATHTFNLPTASAANRGALSSADWTLFNNKQPAIGYTPANDALVVHLAGTETITGNKTFNGDNVYNGVNVYNTYQTRFTVGIAINQTLSGGAVGSHTVIGANVNGLNVNFPGGGYNSLNFASTSVGNTYTFPNATGTLALTSDIPSLTGYVTGTGTSGQVTYFNGTSSVTGADNFKFDGTNLMIGNPSSALANLYVYNASAAASFLLKTNSSTAYSEIAVRNYNDTATSYFRQYSPSTTGSDFGVSRAGLALFFSNYATNFAIGTRNGGDLIFGTADTERARILASNGNFGINESNPTYKLDVNGTGRFSSSVTATQFASLSASGAGAIFLKDSSAVNKWEIGHSGNALYFYNYTSATNPLVLSGATGAATFSANIIANGTSAFYAMKAVGSSASGASYGLVVLAGTTSADYAVRVRNQADNADYFTILGTGAATFSNLVKGKYFNVTGTNGLSGYLIQSGDWEGNASTDLAVASESANLRFYTNGSAAERMRITSGGNVLIGTTTDNGPKLQVAGQINVTSSGSSNIASFNNGSSGYGVYISAGSGGQWNLYAADYAGTANFYVTANGYGYLLGSAWAYGSDFRMKENISNVENGLDMVLKMKPKHFDYINGTKDNLGFIAQDIQEIIPQAVSISNEKTGMLALKTDFLVPYLVKAIQELSAEIEELKLKIK
jgi:hypothetical protein